MTTTLPLSQAKAKLSEVIRTVRRTGEPVVVTIDGEPAARITPVENAPRSLTPTETATVRALEEALRLMPRPSETFDAVALISEGRR